MISRESVIVLDLDDTLYLERDYVRSGFRHVSDWLRQRRGVNGLFEAAWDEFASGSRGDIFDRALSALGCEVAPDLVASLVSEYRAHEPDIRLEPDAAAFLNHRQCAALISDGSFASQRRKVERLELEKWVPLIVLTDELGPEFQKPSRAPFEHVQQRVAAVADVCVYIADNPRKDFQGPKGLGWRTIRIRRPEGLYDSLPSGPDVDAEILTFAEINSLIDIRR